MHKNKFIPLLIIFLISGSLILTPKSAYAAYGHFGGGNFFTNFIEFISQKFGLDKTLVQNAVADFRKQEASKITPRPTMDPADWQAREKIRLDKLVSDGKITTAQEAAILAEMITLRAKYPFNPEKGDDRDDRKKQMSGFQADWKAWATANNIDPNIVWPMGPKGIPGEKRGYWSGHPTPTP